MSAIRACSAASARLRTTAGRAAVALMGLLLWPGALTASDAPAAALAHDEVGNEGEIELGEHSTLADYVAYALRRNPGLRASSGEFEAARERIVQERSLPDPTLTYMYESVTGSPGREHGVSASQMFPWPGKRGLQGEIAAENAEAARRRVEAARLALLYEVKSAYYDYYLLARTVDTFTDNLELMSRLEEVAQANYTVGRTQYSDVVKAQVELGRLEDMLRSVSDRRAVTVARLNAAMGRPVTADLPWPRAAPDDEVEISDEEALALAAGANPELAALEREVAARRLMTDLAAREFYPDIMLGVTYKSMRGEMGGSDDMVGAMVSINVPLWRGRLRAARAEARAMRGAAAWMRAQRENEIAAEVRSVLYELRDARRKVALYRDALIPMAKESLAASETAFRAGTATFIDIVEAQRSWLEFELSYHEGLAHGARRLAELEMLTGTRLSPGGQDAPRGVGR